MKLTAYSDYALRVLTFLAVNDDRLCTIKEIADTYRISKNHLMKLVHELGRAGILETVRGRSGGIRLARPPQEINLGDVVRTTEDDFNIVECFDPQTNRCVISEACRLQFILHEALGAFMNVLDRYTVADLLLNDQTLRRLFERGPAPSAGSDSTPGSQA